MHVSPTSLRRNRGRTVAAHRGRVAPALTRQAGPHHPGGLLPGEVASILRRFELALPYALGPAQAGRPALLRTLTAFARATLERAGEPGAPPGAVARHLAAGSDHALTAAVLLVECTLLHLTDDNAGSERRRIARQLHDEVGSALAVAVHRIELCEDAPADSGAQLAAAKKSLQRAVAENRAVIHDLRQRSRTPRVMDALQAFLADATPAGVEVTVSVTGNEAAASDRCRRELLLVLREALRNSFAHARANRVKVTVRTTPRSLYARVQDNGVGFAVAVTLADRLTGHGLRSMNERVEDLGGLLRLTSRPGGGTRVDIQLPLRISQ